MACRIACAQVDVWRARRARADCLAVQPLDDATLDRAVATDRYEARALSRRKRAIWAFDAPSALAWQRDERACASPVVLWEMALRRAGREADGHASGAKRRAPAGPAYGAGRLRLPDPYAEANKEARRIARLFGHTRRCELAYLQLGKLTRSGRPNTMRPNEPKAAQPNVRNLGQTNPSHSCDAGISPNDPKAVQHDERHFGQTNPSSHKPADTVVAERTEAGAPHRGGFETRPYMRAAPILAKQTRAAAERREFAKVACAGRVGQRSRLAWLRRHNPPPVTICTAALQARCVLWRTRLPATASPRGYRVAGHRGETD
jgi:hypothetical protein